MTPSVTVTQSSVMTTLPIEPPLVGARVCLIHIHLATQEFFPVQVLNRCLGPYLVRHFDKTKTSRLATVFILNDSRGVLPDHRPQRPVADFPLILQMINFQHK